MTGTKVMVTSERVRLKVRLPFACPWNSSPGTDQVKISGAAVALVGAWGSTLMVMPRKTAPSTATLCCPLSSVTPAGMEMGWMLNVVGPPVMLTRKSSWVELPCSRGTSDSRLGLIETDRSSVTFTFAVVVAYSWELSMAR